MCKSCKAVCCKVFDSIELGSLKDVKHFSEYGKVFKSKEKKRSWTFHFENKRCPFLKRNKCSIYEERPHACKIFTCSKIGCKISKTFVERANEFGWKKGTHKDIYVE